MGGGLKSWLEGRGLAKEKGGGQKEAQVQEGGRPAQQKAEEGEEQKWVGEET